MSIKKRGFGSMSPEKRKTIARRGGLRSAELGHAHKFTHEEAIAAGRKGRKKPVTIAV